MTKDACLDGPFTIDLKVVYIGEDGEQAVAAYSLPPGTVPTDASIQGALVEVAKRMQDYPAFRPMTRHEFVNSLLPDTGMSWAVGGPDTFRLDSEAPAA